MTAVNPNSNPAPKSLPGWRFWLPLVAQAVLIVAVPAPAVYTQLTGKTVVLKTVPVDPYEFLRGYSVILNYEISSLATLQKLPGGQILNQQPARYGSYDSAVTHFYLVLEAPVNTTTEPPSPWQPVKVSRDRPTNLPANQVALQGRVVYNSVEYGLETYYIPEDQRVEINEDISQAQRSRQPRPIVVNVKVNRQGNAVPSSFWVGDRQYRF